MNRLSEQKILMLEQELQNKKKQFSVEKEALEKKSFEMENQLQILKKKNISTKKSSQCQTNESMNSIKEAESMKKEYEKKNSLVSDYFCELSLKILLIIQANSREKRDC